MRRSVPMPPTVTNPSAHQQWKRDLVGFLQSLPQAGDPQALLLESWTAEAKATTDGLLMYNRSLGAVVVAIGGAWFALGSGGGGGSASWGGITGTLSAQTDLQTALNGKAALVHTHLLADLLQSGATTGQVVTWSGAAWVPSAAHLTYGSASLSLPSARYEHYETITAVGVAVTSMIDVWLDPGTDQDENVAEMLDIVTLAGTPKANQIDIVATFDTPTSGNIKINWGIM